MYHKTTDYKMESNIIYIPRICDSLLSKKMRSSGLEDFNTFGFLFESLCTRDMRIYLQSNDGDVYHYRDKNG